MSEVVTYISPFSILVHNKAGLRRIYCPFKVMVRHEIFEETIGKFHMVMKVGESDGRIFYFIDEIWFQYSMFEIL